LVALTVRFGVEYLKVTLASLPTVDADTVKVLVALDAATLELANASPPATANTAVVVAAARRLKRPKRPRVMVSSLAPARGEHMSVT
jgi:hypothetical protein